MLGVSQSDKELAEYNDNGFISTETVDVKVIVSYYMYVKVILGMLIIAFGRAIHFKKSKLL